MDQSSVRLNKALAAAGYCSRRQADALIASGRVRVNGCQVTALGTKIDPRVDRISVEGRPLSQAPTRQQPPLTIMLHKKPGVVTTARDPEGRPTVFDHLPAPYRERRLFSVGRLDYFSEGLLLLTTDGDLAFRLTHPRWHVSKVYRVVVRGQVTPAMLTTMEDGMTLAEGEKLASVRVRLGKRLGPDRCTMEMELGQGINRQIRRMCRDLGLTVLKLIRIAQGPLRLGSLLPGECRELTGHELTILRQAVGLPEANKTRT